MEQGWEAVFVIIGSVMGVNLLQWFLCIQQLYSDTAVKLIPLIDTDTDRMNELINA